MATHPKHADCQNCEAPCCRRQFMEDEDGWYSLADIRPIYQAVGTDIRVVGWNQQAEGRQPMIQCNAFDVVTLACTVYDARPEHCREYDCREDDPDEWESRAHCDIERHRKLEAIRATRAS